MLASLNSHPCLVPRGDYDSRDLESLVALGAHHRPGKRRHWHAESNSQHQLEHVKLELEPLLNFALELETLANLMSRFGWRDPSVTVGSGV